LIIFASVNRDIYTPIMSKPHNFTDINKINITTCLGRKRVVLITQHPSSDHGVINKPSPNYKSRCNVLSESWQCAKNLSWNSKAP